MIDEDGELLPPGAFLPSAERSGLIEEIDSWVTRTRDPPDRPAAARRAASCASRSTSRGARSATAPCPEAIEDELGEASIDPANLIFEVTETRRGRQHGRGEGVRLSPGRPRLPLRARRLRRRLRVLLLPQVPAARLPQDRRRLHRRPGAQPDRPGGRQGDRRAARQLGKATIAEFVGDDAPSSCCASTASTTCRATTSGSRSRSRSSGAAPSASRSPGPRRVAVSRTPSGRYRPAGSASIQSQRLPQSRRQRDAVDVRHPGVRRVLRGECQRPDGCRLTATAGMQVGAVEA